MDFLKLIDLILYEFIIELLLSCSVDFIYIINLLMLVQTIFLTQISFVTLPQLYRVMYHHVRVCRH